MEQILTLEELIEIGITIVSCGFIVGCIPMIIGYAIETLVNIFKRV